MLPCSCPVPENTEQIAVELLVLIIQFPLIDFRVEPIDDLLRFFEGFELFYPVQSEDILIVIHATKHLDCFPIVADKSNCRK